MGGGSELYSNTVCASDVHVTRGSLIHRLAARAMILDWEQGTWNHNAPLVRMRRRKKN